jgi:TRAP transporter TAXI family solute receptor
MRLLVRTSLLCTALLFLGSCTENLSTNRPYILTTATTGGTYYPVGVALATITKAQLYETEGISLSAISSAGSMENIKLMRDNQAQFALLQGIFAAWAWNGDGPISKPQPWLRSIAALWANADHFVLLTELTTDGSIMDLDLLNGHRFVMGARNSGAEKSGDYILQGLGIDYESKFDLAYMGYGATANAIQDGTPNVFAVRADIPDEAVYQITKSLWENLAALHEIHKATREVTLDKALSGLGAPLHPGAARYYREQGLEIPAELVPP